MGVRNLKFAYKNQTKRKKNTNKRIIRISPLQGDSVSPLYHVTIKFKALIGIMAILFVQRIRRLECHLLRASMPQHVPDGTKQHFNVNKETTKACESFLTLLKVFSLLEYEVFSPAIYDSDDDYDASVNQASKVGNKIKVYLPINRLKQYS